MTVAVETKYLADAILSLRHQVKKEQHNIPGVGLVWIWGLTQGELGQYHKDIRGADGKMDLATCDVQFFWRIVRDEKGFRLFDATQCHALMDLPSDVVRPAVAIGERLCGMTPASDAAVEKNSGTQDQKATDSGS
jgi:hypothetical protein